MSAGDGWLQGIDVSKWQTTTPSLTGVHYLIARAGLGTKPDAMYSTHIAAAKKAGIITGSYWYNIGAVSVADQVAAYAAREGDVDIHVLDWEGTDGFTAAQATDFIKRYKALTGNRIFLYASESRFRDLGQDLDWIANYSNEPTKHYDLWQYGPFHGADGNYFRGTVDDLKTLIGASKPMRTFTLPSPLVTGTVKVNGTGHAYLRLLDNTLHNITDPVAFGSRAAVKVALTEGITPTDPRKDGYLIGSEAAFVLAADVTFVPTPVGVDDGITQATVDAAVLSATSTALANGIAQGKEVGTATERQRLRALLGI